MEEFPVDPEGCEHAVWNPDNRQCLDCGHINPEDLPASRLPIDSIVARNHVVYIKSMPSEWYSTNGTKHTDDDIDRFLTGERWARVLRVGDGKNRAPF